MFFVVISISIYIFGIYLILVLSNCKAIQSTDCHVRYFNKLSIIYLSWLIRFLFIFLFVYFKLIVVRLSCSHLIPCSSPFSYLTRNDSLFHLFAVPTTWNRENVGPVQRLCSKPVFYVVTCTVASQESVSARNACLMSHPYCT